MPLGGRSELLLCVLLASVGILLLTYAELRIVGLTSSLTLAVVGVLHSALFVAAGMALFGDQLSWRHAVGSLLILAGSLSAQRHLDILAGRRRSVPRIRQLQ